MVKNPTHINTEEPKELGPDPVDITGKEPVLVRDWDTDRVQDAVLYGQRDIIDHELNYLLAQPAWNRPAPVAYGRVITRHADLAARFLSMCRLDMIPVYIHEEAGV